MWVQRMNECRKQKEKGEKHGKTTERERES
jgi:hypothetical protein